MNYSIFILRRAQKELASLPTKEFQKIKSAINSLEHDPRPANCKKLTGRDGWRLRTGNYRIIYEIDDASRRITILHIGHRRDVYR